MRIVDGNAHGDTANALFTAGLSVGDLSVLSVVSGFYPAVTIVLALLAMVGMSLA